MAWVELSAGPVEYVDTGGEGPVVVLCHGVPMSPTQWRAVVPLLDDVRCVLPTLPFGGHARPMRADADLTQTGVARLLGELVVALDLDRVTLVLNDWGGGQFLLTERYPGADRVARLALVACEAFDNFPPGRAAKLMARLCRLPGGTRLALALMRTELVRRQPSGYGGMSVRGIPADVMDDWFEPTRDPAIRRDFEAFSTGTPDRAWLLDAARRLATFDGPAMVIWALQDRLMPRDHGRRLAELLPHGRLVEVEDSSTLVPQDQPELLAGLIRELAHAT